MQRGPKRQITAPPLDLSRLPKARAARCIKFIETYCYVPKGHGALKRVKLRPWQKALIRGLLRPGIRQALWSMARGNGKSMLAALLALYFFFADGTQGARVLVVASSEPQARLIFDTCRRIIELNPVLLEQVKVFQDRLVLEGTDSVLQPLPASARSLQGYDPSVVIVDELSVVGDETFESMALALGKRPNSLLLAISTAPLDVDSAMHRLREHGMQGDDDSFFFQEWSAPPGCGLDDEEAWAAANPALGDFLDVASVRSQLRTVREAQFRRFRLNQTVTDSDSWLEWGQWERLAAPRTLPAGARVVLGFDGSVSGDSTAIVAVTVEERPYVALQRLWERPAGVKEWRVPRHEVTAMVDTLYSTYDVLEMACDPHHWRSEIEAWAVVHPTVIEFATHTPSLMCPATDRAFALIAEGKLSHDGNEDLARHMRAAMVKNTTAGVMLTKVHAGPTAKKMDACIATVIALERAAWHFHNAPKRRRVYAF